MKPINRIQHFAQHHQISGARIAATSAALALHVAGALALALPAGKADYQVRADDVVATVTFVPLSGKDFRPAPPAPPPAPMKAPPKAPKPSIAPPPATAPVEGGEEPVEVSHFSVDLADAKELSSLDLPEPDSPPTEILSYRSSNPPSYPMESIAAGESGWVTLRVLVDAEGAPLTFTLARSTAPDRLILAAIDAVKLWRFNPAMKDGKPVPAWIEVPIGFFNERAGQQPVAQVRG